LDCSRICLWRPHGFPLCPNHLQHPMTCYLLKIPIEMRLRIYGYLLPDKPIPARYGNSRCLTSGGGLVYTALLRVNHQIHDEAVHLLYAPRSFTIELGTDGLVMCNSSKKSPGGNHALQDYQMQLMLLEQQNKKRLMMARLEQDMMTNGGSSSSSNPPVINRQMPNTGPPIIPYTSGPVEPAWYPPLSMKYFNMIQSSLLKLYSLLQTNQTSLVAMLACHWKKKLKLLSRNSTTIAIIYTNSSGDFGLCIDLLCGYR
jgi:hypothetical protein